MEKPAIEYPCTWSYKLIGQDKERLRIAATSAAAHLHYTISESNKSSGGKYHSINLEIEVSSDDERLGIFDKLKGNGDVKIVL